MSNWKLNPPAVRAVLASVSDTIEHDDNKGLMDLESADLSDSVVDGGSGVLNFVPQALSDLFEREHPVFETVGNRLRAAVEGVSLADAAYEAAQQYMVDDTARDAQCAAFENALLGAARTGDFSAFAPYETKGSAT